MDLYKLTSPEGRTRGGVLWGPGIVNPATSGDGPLCSNAWYHAYTDPLLAVFLDPIHGNFGSTSRLFLCHGIPGTFDPAPGARCLKVGATSLSFISWLTPVRPSIRQRVAFGIFCALSVSSSRSFVTWAEAWLAGTDRSAHAAAHAANAAADAAAYAAAHAADAAAHAADAVDAADAAAHAADAAAYAANDAANVNLSKMAAQAMAY